MRFCVLSDQQEVIEALQPLIPTIVHDKSMQFQTYQQYDAIIIDCSTNTFDVNSLINYRPKHPQLFLFIINEGTVFSQNLDTHYFLSIDFLTSPLTISDVYLRCHHWHQQQYSFKQLIHNNLHLHHGLNTIPDLVWFKDSECNYQYANTALLDLAQVSLEEVIGASDADIWHHTIDEICQHSDQRVLTEKKTITFEECFPHENGNAFFEVHKSPIFDDQQQVTGIFGFARELTNLKNIETELELTLKHLPFAVCIRDTSGKITYLNDSFHQMYQNALNVGDNMYDTPTFLTEIDLSFLRGKDHEVIETRQSIVYQTSSFINDRQRTFEIVKSPIFDISHVLQKILIVIRDITTEVTQQAQLEALAYTDSLTSLANWGGLYSFLSTPRPIHPFGTLFMIDLTNFKSFNERFGHQIGNEMLKNIARILKKLYPLEFISRNSSDEFSLVLSFTKKPCMNTLEEIAEHILSAINTTHTLNNAYYKIIAKIGFVPFEFNSITADECLSQAELALKQVKLSNTLDYLLYTPSLELHQKRTDQLIHDLRIAMEHKELCFFYQPKYTCAGQLFGFEALLRWPNNQYPDLTIEDFITALESSPYIYEFGDYVFTQVFQFIQLILQITDEIFPISINLSASQLIHPQFIEKLTQLLSKYSIPADWVELEITETVFLDNVEQTTKKLMSLRELGISIALDDFGTGYSSLNYLAQLPVSTLKIDRSFIQKMTLQSKQQQLVKMIIDTAHIFNLVVVAEGVETAEELEILTIFNTDFIQGYFFSKPLSTADTLQLIRKQKANV